MYTCWPTFSHFIHLSLTDRACGSRVTHELKLCITVGHLGRMLNIYTDFILFSCFVFHKKFYLISSFVLSTWIPSKLTGWLLPVFRRHSQGRFTWGFHAEKPELQNRLTCLHEECLVHLTFKLLYFFYFLISSSRLWFTIRTT